VTGNVFCGHAYWKGHCTLARDVSRMSWHFINESFQKLFYCHFWSTKNDVCYPSLIENDMCHWFSLFNLFFQVTTNDSCRLRETKNDLHP
jgi:hypothetical protein